MSCMNLLDVSMNLSARHYFMLSSLEVYEYTQRISDLLDPNCLQTLKAGRKRRERERRFGTKFVFLAWFLRHLGTSPSILLQLLSIRTHGMYYRSHWQYYIWVQSGSKLFAYVNRAKERNRDSAFAQSDQCLYTVLIRKMCASCIVGRCKKLIKFLTTHCRSEVISNMRTVFQEEKIP